MPIITGTSNLIETWAASGTRVSASDGKIATGWTPTERPPSQWFNFIIHQIESKINHLLRNGIALWNSSTTYPQGACVTHSLRPWTALNASQNSTPSTSNADWGALATVAEVQGIVPIGCGVWTYAQTAPAGFIFFQGQAISRSENPALFAVLGTRFGAGDGSTTFNVPEERGLFFRGWDNGRGVDAGRLLGTQQTDLLREHSHGNVPLYVPTGDTDRGANIGAFSLDQVGFTANAGGAETRPINISGRYMYRLG
jgi:microcystin-dependent protein